MGRRSRNDSPRPTDNGSSWIVSPALPYWNRLPDTPLSGRRIAPHGRSWLNSVPRPRAAPARLICCASAWKRSSESDLAPAEDVALAAEAVRLQSADDLRESAQSAVHALAGPEDEAGGALAMLYAARKAFESAVSRDAAATQLGDRLAEASYQLTDLTADLVRYLEGLDSQPGRLEQIAERRAQLSTLTRKYGTTCDEVLQWAADSAVRLTQLEQSDERIATLTERLEQLSDRVDLTRRSDQCRPT